MGMCLFRAKGVKQNNISPDDQETGGMVSHRGLFSVKTHRLFKFSLWIKPNYGKIFHFVKCQVFQQSAGSKFKSIRIERLNVTDASDASQYRRTDVSQSIQTKTKAVLASFCKLHGLRQAFSLRPTLSPTGKCAGGLWWELMPQQITNTCLKDGAGTSSFVVIDVKMLKDENIT